MKKHNLHEGEKFLQTKRHTPSSLTDQIPALISTEMPHQHQEFFSSLPYLPIATIDEHGRPWASIFVTQSEEDQSVGIKIKSEHESNIHICTKISQNDPVYRALSPSKDLKEKDLLFAGVGLDFSNRRRNKLSGHIKSVLINKDNKLEINLKSNEHLGNCPKYITLRSLVPHPRKEEVAFSSFDLKNESLPSICKDHINNSSTVFLATKHISSNKDESTDMGLNHRGGNPGFIRVYEKDEFDKKSNNMQTNTYLVLPDYSGNRFYQSLGNIETDNLVGLSFPDFKTGAILHITGVAKNLFDEDAQKVMPRSGLITQIRVTGAIFRREAINLLMTSNEQLSPYNPPIRYLSEELQSMGHISNLDIKDSISATLTSVKKITSSISTFSFKLSQAIEMALPGGFSVFDFSKFLSSGYHHMDEITPQNVNDDYIRTWTISSAPSFDLNKQQFTCSDLIEITVKQKENGLISNFLHEKTNLLSQDSLALKGIGGGFSCFYKDLEKNLLSIPANMLWIAGGVGITPFMSMWDGIINIYKQKSKSNLSSIITLVFAGRDDDLTLIEHFLKEWKSCPSEISFKIMVFQSLGNKKAEAQESLESITEKYPDAPIIIKQRRFKISDLNQVDNLLDCETFLCGPEALTKEIQNWLQLKTKNKIYNESYFF